MNGMADLEGGIWTMTDTEFKRELAEAKAEALEEAAIEIDRLRVIGKTPYAECTQNESVAFLQFAEVKPEAWLRARANAMRGEA